MSSVKFRRVVTGYRCHELGCYSVAVWYVETEAEFFHWCPKHAVIHMRDSSFWKGRFQQAATPNKVTRATKSR